MKQTFSQTSARSMWPCGSGGPHRCRFAPEVASSAPPSSMGLRRPLHPAARCGGPFLNGPLHPAATPSLFASRMPASPSGACPPRGVTLHEPPRCCPAFTKSPVLLDRQGRENGKEKGKRKEENVICGAADDCCRPSHVLHGSVSTAATAKPVSR